MTMRLSLLLLLGCLFTSAYAANDPVTATAQLKSAVVYRSGAELTHTATAQLKQGNNELIIGNISNAIDINSIQVNVASAVSLMGVEFSANFLKEAALSPRAKQLQDSAETLQGQLDQLQIGLNNTSELIDVLRQNRSIKGEQTGLSVTELTRLLDYYKAKLLELQTDMAAQQAKKIRLQEALVKIKRQLEEEKNRNAETGGRLVLQLSAAIAGNYEFTVSYIATNAGWTPFYDVRVDNINQPLKVIYKAGITQTTGIEWKKIRLSLSTSTPSQWGDAPLFKPWFLSYVNPVRKLSKALQGRVPGVSVDAVEKESLSEVVVVGYGGSQSDDIRIRGAGSLNGDKTPLYIVNGAEMSKEDFARLGSSAIKQVQVLKDASATAIYGSRGNNGVVLVTLKDGLEDYVSVTDNALQVSFDIDMPYDVPANGKPQTAVLKTMEIAAKYKHYAVPKLEKETYLVADVADWEGLNLLPGTANIILEGTYVGKSFIDPNSTLDTMSLTLGKDRRVVVKRDKLVDFSSVKFLGSSKLQRFTYEITVKNNKKEAVDLLLKDQYPLSTGKEIEVELEDNGKADIDKDLGILSWHLQLAPNESRKIRFTYTVKYPKDKMLNLN